MSADWPNAVALDIAMQLLQQTTTYELPEGMTSEQWIAAFWKAYHMLRTPPVFHCSSLEDRGIADDVKAGLLRIDPSQESQQSISDIANEKLGFDPFSQVHLLEGDLRDWLTMKDDKWIRTRTPLQSVVEETGFPDGALFDFEYWPAHMCTFKILDRWLRARNVRYQKTDDFQKLVESVNDIRKEEPPRKILSRAQYTEMQLPFVPDADSDGNTIMWKTVGEEVFTIIRNNIHVPNIDNSFLQRIVFSVSKRTGVKRRAELLIQNGNFDLSTLKVRFGKCGDKPCTLLQIVSTPSMKRKPYKVSLAFYNNCTDSLVPSISGCECIAGLNEHGCSHTVGFLNFLALIQKKETMPWDKFAQIMPPPVYSITDLGIPLAYVSFEPNKKRKREN